MSNIDINSLPSNSHKSKSEAAANTSTPKTVTQVAQKEKLAPAIKKDAVVSTKKPLGDKFKELFIPEDVKDVKSYVVMDVIIPGIKNTVLDVLEMMFFGEIRGRKKKSYYDGGKERVSYNSYYRSDSSRGSSRSRDRRDDRDDKVDYRNIVLRNRGDAEEVVDRMHKRIKEFGAASVADLLDLIDVSGRYTDNNWGWTDERDIGVRRVSSGYLIDVSEAEYLD